MLYNDAFESELSLEEHILLWTVNELGGRLLNFHEDSTFLLLLLHEPINSKFTTGLPQPPTYRVALLVCTIACIYEAARTYLLDSLPGELKRAKNHIPTKRALVLTVSSGLSLFSSSIPTKHYQIPIFTSKLVPQMSDQSVKCTSKFST